MIEVKNLPHNYRHKVSQKIEYIEFFPILDRLLCGTGYKNDFNFSHDVNEISSGGKLYNMRLEHSEYNNIHINIDYYDNTGFFDVTFQYVHNGTEYCENSIKTHSLNIVLSCMEEIGKLLFGSKL